MGNSFVRKLFCVTGRKIKTATFNGLWIILFFCRLMKCFCMLVLSSDFSSCAVPCLLNAWWINRFIQVFVSKWKTNRIQSWFQTSLKSWMWRQLWTVHFQLSWYRCCVRLKYSTMITEDWQCHHKALLITRVTLTYLKTKEINLTCLHCFFCIFKLEYFTHVSFKNWR